MQTKLDLYDRTVSLAQLGIWEWNLLTGELYWNAVARTIYEVGPEFVPSVAHSLLFYLDKDSAQQLIDEVITCRQSRVGTFQLRATSGTVKWVRMRASVCLDMGICTALYGTLEDITQEVTKANSFLEREQRFHQAFDFAPIGMALVSLKGNWLKVNTSLCRLLGYTESELLQITFQDITFQDDLDTDLEQMNRLLTGTIDRYHIEKRYIHKNSQLIWTLLHVSLVRDQKNEPLYFVSQIKNISERKNYVDLLQRERQRLDNIIQSTNVGTWEWDLRNDQVIYNQKLVAILGYNPDKSSISKIDFWSSLLHPDDQQTGNRLLKQYLRREVDIYTFECRMLHQEGQWIWVEVRGKIIDWEEGDQPRLMIGTCMDIHARKSLEEEQRKTLELVSSQNARLLNFAHIVSHNLRSHTGNIQLLVEMLSQELDEKERQEYMDMLGLNIVNLQETLVHLNEVIQMRGNKTKDKKPLQLRYEIDRILTTLSQSLRQAQAQVYVDVSEHIVVQYNPAYLESVLLNLISNCLKYSHPDRTPVIRLSAFPSEDGIVLKVADNGQGIDLNMHGHKLFGMYKTFHGNADARGIGLFITKNQVEAMNGRISVESQVNRETTFTVTIKS
ncbi:PAS domain-containing sensor histidine kinase [Spirosoma lituiforme]